MVSGTTRKCVRCGTVKSLTEFHRNRSKAGGRKYECKDCCRSMDASRVRDRSWRDEKLQRYGMTQADFDRMLAEQGGGCALCGNTDARNGHSHGRLVVDHDHETGRVRGLLCQPCNTSIGRLGDTPATISRVLAYVEGQPFEPALASTPSAPAPRLFEVTQ